MADPSIFGNYFSSAAAMGNPATPKAGAYDPWEQDILSKMSPDVAGAIMLNKKREDVYNDPNRFGELLNVLKEFRAEEAQNAAKIQAERDKRAFQYGLVAELPRTINQIGANLAQMTYNAPRLEILARTPQLIAQSYGSMPRINIPTFS